MVPRRRLRLAASSGAGVALIGVWLGHTLEYVRLAGAAGLRQELVGSVHWYMAPLGLLLALVAAAGAVRLVGMWSALGRQLAWTRFAVGQALRGERGLQPPPGLGRRPQPVALRITGLWLPLAAAQIVLFVVQENVEYAAAGYPAPGLGAITGVHWAAPLIHAGVALVLACVAVMLHRVLQRRSHAVAATEALLRLLLAHLTRAISWATPRHLARAGIVDRFGRLWCRPPPLLTAG
jgi:hypothetical protein